MKQKDLAINALFMFLLMGVGVLLLTEHLHPRMPSAKEAAIELAKKAAIKLAEKPPRMPSAKEAVELARQLRQLDTDDAGRTLARLMDHPDGIVRITVIPLLKYYDIKETRDALFRHIDDKIFLVQLHAISSLGIFRDKRAVPKLLEKLGGNNGDLIASCALALGRIGDRSAMEPLIGRLEIRDAGIRSQVIKALGLLGDKRAAPPLRELLRSEKSPDLRMYAKAALYMLGDGAFEKELLVFVANETGRRSGSVRMWTARALAAKGRAEGAQALLDFLADGRYFGPVLVLLRELFPGMPIVNTFMENAFPDRAGKAAEWVVKNTFNGQLKMPDFNNTPH